MSNFWNNIGKFPRFLISVTIGFFLITFKPIFKLLKNRNRKITFIIIITLAIRTIQRILELMTKK